MPRSRLLASTILAGFTMTAVGCTASVPPAEAPRAASIAVNPDYLAGRIEIPTASVPSLEEIINRVPSRRSETVSTQEDRLRNSAMRDAALSYGARAGLAWESRGINRLLMERAPEISRTFDFQRVMIRGPDNVMILPPVISEARENWESSEAGRVLRVADTVYEIMEQARFTPVAPLWQAYLVRDYRVPEPPPDVLLPRDGAEREQWSRWTREGWEMGRQQAQEIFQADLERLERDFQGMVRYRRLLEEGKVSAPVVADARFGTTGTGQDMRVNDRAIRITRDPSLNVQQPQSFRAAPTTPNAAGRPTGDPRRPVTTPVNAAGAPRGPVVDPAAALDAATSTPSRTRRSTDGSQSGWRRF